MRAPGLAVPLVVDLDGTLIRSDSLAESLLLLARERPVDLLRLPAWLLRGRAALKAEVFARAAPDLRTLPFEPALLDFLHEQRSLGRRLVLASGCDRRFVRAVADALGLFDEVIASDGVHNLTGTAKRDRLVSMFGAQGFDYVGNERADLPVWAASREALLVRPTPWLTRSVARVAPIGRVFDDGRAKAVDIALQLRVHHWPKNVLVFVPLLTAAAPPAAGTLAEVALACLAFCLAASSVYLLNDLLDLPADRRHPEKRRRPLASGRVPIRPAMAAMPLLWTGAAAIALGIGHALGAAVGLYSLLMLAYCLRLKDLAIVDALVLALGYTLRVVAGAHVAAVDVSPWLLVGSMFLFFSLALLKRYAELVSLRGHPSAHDRGYREGDATAVAMLGGAAGCVAVLVLAVVPVADPATHLARGPVWGVCSVLLLWIGHMWLMAQRGAIRTDPVHFALQDTNSRVLAAAMAALLLLLR